MNGSIRPIPLALAGRTTARSAERAAALLPGVTMELIERYAEPVSDKEGNAYVVAVYGERSPHGHWHGWLSFMSVKDGEILVTDQETSQPHREALLFWSTGLHPTYLEGALARAIWHRHRVRQEEAHATQ